MKNEVIQLNGYINPLAFHEVEEPWASLNGVEVNDEHLRHFLCQPGLGFSLEEIVARFHMISIEDTDRIIAAPLGVLRRLIWPLRHAKSSYALGNYLGSITLCGTVLEMAALLIFEASAEHWGFREGRVRLTPSVKKLLPAGAFERAPQSQRLQALHDLKLIDRETRARFEFVRKIRNKNMHVFTEADGSIEVEAVEVYIATVKNVIYTLGLGIKDGMLTYRPELYSWLRKHSPETVGDVTKDQAPREELA